MGTWAGRTQRSALTLVRSTVALLALLLTLARPELAFAHAYLERSSPAGNTIVESAPGRIQLWFTERPELSFSEVTVYASDGTKLPHGPISLAADNPRSIVFDLPVTPHGTYTVAWTTLSADDGHVAAGALAYAVGLEQPAPTAASMFVPAGQAAETSRPNPVAVLGRLLTYAGVALSVGGPLFLLLVLWPSSRPARGGGLVGVGGRGVGRLPRLHWAGLALLLLGVLAGLLGQALAVGRGDPAALVGALLNLVGTRSG